MFKKYSIIILALFILTTFSSCGFISMDLSGAANQFTDFSPEDSYEVSEDCGCYGPPSSGNCNRMYAPVCGCDGITYDNACVARRSGIYIYRRGECGKPYPIKSPYKTTRKISQSCKPADSKSPANKLPRSKAMASKSTQTSK